MASQAKPSGADTSYWIKFFTECGIPPSESTNYAITFTDNRIQKDMLMDLTKEYLTEMGISILGDVIAILKHAKTVHSQLAREKALQGTKNISSTPRRQTAASRTVNHYLGNDPDSAPMNLAVVPKLSKELSARLGGTPPVEESGLRSTTVKLSKKLEEVVPVPKKRRVFPEHEGKYKITMPSGKTQKTKKLLAKAKKTDSVFDRLGSETRQTTVTNSGLLISSTSEGSVFSRLGGKQALKREATSTSLDLDSDEDDEGGEQLEYAGIFKNTPSPAKKPKVPVMKKITITKQVTAKVPAKKLVATAGILSEDAEIQLNKRIKERLGKKTSLQEVSSTTDEIDATRSGAVYNRLGPKKVATVSKKPASPVGVFGRLGKPVTST
ncbi:uncharacterized protein C19orf47-like isoform X2 [Mytilus californianus]|uniref:uncharacterized protein C19orf47-like isoform X2 n=1 Tax=Mytilus californianus TaxID=6549 RepID=UPI002247BC59|nr:uncharacterized protein C19orf47-like isoform X2 [Mytilus californianus]